MLHTPILIVGGSLVGLSASLFLSWRGVANLVVDKHPGSSPHPRAMGFTETTLECYRTVGIADRIPQAPAGTRLRRVAVDSLAGEWRETPDWTPGEPAGFAASLSPCTGAAIAQDRLEPILRAAARAHGAQLRPSTELLSFVQHGDGVTARVRDRADGREHEIRADYLIAADGADSGIRAALGIARQGVGHLRTLRSVLFSCPEADAFLARGAQQFAIEQDGFHAFLTTYGDGRWVLMFDGDEERDDDQLRAAIRRALGRDMAFEIITTGRWEMAGRIAQAFSSGRVFLAGDAAHQLPPTRGGFGANTGIADAWNLAWKLQRVLQGTSTAALLETYDAERRPVAWLRHQQTFSRPDYARWVGSDFAPEPLFSNEAMEFGQLQRSDAVLGADPGLAAAASVGQWSGQPGTRAPHVALRNAASTLDFLGRDFVLLTAAPDWVRAAQALALSVVRVGTDAVFPDDQSFEQAFGVPADGATLVRPDGIVAWRGGPAHDAVTELRRVFERVAMRPRAD